MLINVLYCSFTQDVPPCRPVGRPPGCRAARQREPLRLSPFAPDSSMTRCHVFSGSGRIRFQMTSVSEAGRVRICGRVKHSPIILPATRKSPVGGQGTVTVTDLPTYPICGPAFAKSNSSKRFWLNLSIKMQTTLGPGSVFRSGICALAKFTHCFRYHEFFMTFFSLAIEV